MNIFGVFKIAILLFVVVSGVFLRVENSHIELNTCFPGWVVLGGHTKIEDPTLNFRDAFAGSSHSSNDVSLA